MATLRTEPARIRASARLRFALAAAMFAGVLCIAPAGPFGAAAALAGPGPFGATVPSYVPAHGGGEDELDRDGAIAEARHVVDELSAENRIDDGWKAADVAGAETRTMRVFRMWVVHFHSAADIGGNGTDLYVFMALNGEFLKYSYNGR